MTIRTASRVAALTAAAFVAPAACLAASPGYEGLAPLFADDSVLDVTIAAPLSTLMEVRPDKAYLDGSFSYVEPGGTRRKLGIKLRTRGNFRRDPEHCSFPPIRLNLRAGELDGTLFEGQDKLKLVTHCRANDGRYEQLVAREYIAYRLFHQLSSASYAARMMRVTYFDTETGDSLERLAFVIEDDAAVAARNGLQLARVRNVDPADLDPQRQNLVHVFEYMIGNTEYSFVNPEPGKNCCHNADLLTASGDPPYLPLPFDFDFAGLVNAPYAQPNPRYPIPIVRVRYYKGVCSNNDLLPGTLRQFLMQRDAFDAITTNARFLSGKSRRSIRDFLASFFREISDPLRAAETLAGRCRDVEDSYGETLVSGIDAR